MRDVHITPDVTDFDAAMREAYREPSVVYLADGHYLTAGINPWNRTPGRGFIIDGQLIMGGDVTIEIDGSLIPDALVNGEPLIALKGRGVWDSVPDIGALSPAGVWNYLPVEQTVYGGMVRCNHSKLVDRWRGLGHPLKTAAVQLHGHGPLIAQVRAVDAGAYRTNPAEGAESFPFVCAGVDGALDSTPLLQLDPAKYIFDMNTRAAAVTGCTFEAYVPEASNDQVTVVMITGVLGERNGWNQGGWGYMWRRDWLIDHNTVRATGKNLVQGFTGYLGHAGRCTNNYTEGADVGSYQDFVQTENSVYELNQFLKCRHGISFYLSPVPRPLCDNFSHKGHKIGLNKITSSGTNVSLDTLNREFTGPDKSARVIKNIGVHSSLSVEALDGAEYYMIDPAAKKRRGCL